MLYSYHTITTITKNSLIWFFKGYIYFAKGLICQAICLNIFAKGLNMNDDKFNE